MTICRAFRVSVQSLAALAMCAMLAGTVCSAPLVAQENSAQESGAQVRPRSSNFTTHTLPNGLQVILLEDHDAPIINLQVWYHVGGKDEQPGHTGFAHLFEHLMFKGSAHVGPDEHSRIIEAVGGFDNAETNDDTTQFLRNFPQQLSRARPVARSRPHGQPERGRSKFQIRARSGRRRAPRARRKPALWLSIEEDLRAAAFTVHGYHHTPIGSIEDLDKATLQDVRDFFNTYYKPNNATLVIVGDFNSAQALAWTKKYFDGIPASAKPIPRLNKPEPPQTEERVVKKSYTNTPLPAVVIGYKIPRAIRPDAYPLDLASNILAGGESSRLYQTLVYKDQIAVQSAGFGNFTEDPNLFWAYAIMNQGHTAEEGEKAHRGRSRRAEERAGRRQRA